MPIHVVEGNTVAILATRQLGWLKIVFPVRGEKKESTPCLLGSRSTMDFDVGCNASGECGLSLSVPVVVWVCVAVLGYLVYKLRGCCSTTHSTPTYTRAENVRAIDAPRRRATASGPIC